MGARSYADGDSVVARMLAPGSRPGPESRESMIAMNITALIHEWVRERLTNGEALPEGTDAVCPGCRAIRLRHIEGPP